MDGIMKHLQDPGWWFTAVIMSILVSVAAGFAKDYLERKFGVFLLRSKEKRENARSARKQAIEAWSRNEGLVTLMLLGVVHSSFVVIALISSSLLLVIYMRVTYGDDQNIPISLVFVLAMMVVLVILAIWKSSTELSNTRECFREFRRRRELPQLKGADW